MGKVRKIKLEKSLANNRKLSEVFLIRFVIDLIWFNVASELLPKVIFFVSSYIPLHKDIKLINVIKITLKRFIVWITVELIDLKITTIFFNIKPKSSYIWIKILKRESKISRIFLKTRFKLFKTFFERTLIDDSLFVENILIKPNHIKNETGRIIKAVSIYFNFILFSISNQNLIWITSK